MCASGGGKGRPRVSVRNTQKRGGNVSRVQALQQAMDNPDFREFADKVGCAGHSVTGSSLVH